MEENQLNTVSLLPRSKRLRKGVCDRSHYSLSALLMISISFCFVSVISNLAQLLVDYYSSNPIMDHCTRIVSDCSRMAYYMIVLSVGRRYKTFQDYAAYPIPIIFSVVICETYAAAGMSALALVRYSRCCPLTSG